MDKVEREKYRQEMTAVIRQWESSGKTQVQYCTEHGLKLSVFYYWLRRYHQGTSPGGFVPVQVVKGKNPGKVPDTSIVIRYPNGTSIHLPYSTPLATIRRLAGL